MFSKANLVSTIVTAIWGFGGGYLLWGIIGEPMLEEHMTLEGIMKEMPDMMYLALGCLVQGFAFSTIYGKIGASEYGAGSGVKYGIFTGLLVGLGGGLIDFATGNLMNMTGTMMNAVIYIVFFAVMGALAGMIYKKMG